MIKTHSKFTLECLYPLFLFFQVLFSILFTVFLKKNTESVQKYKEILFYIPVLFEISSLIPFFLIIILSYVFVISRMRIVPYRQYPLSLLNLKR